MLEVAVEANGQLSFLPPLKTSPEATLFSLAMKKENSSSPSVQFWCNFARHFIESIRLDPAVEELREKCDITLAPGKTQEFLTRAPFMKGGEYLNEDYLSFQWNNLQNHFSQQLKSFKGSVEEYLLGLNFETHLVGKVYFHLVENKSDPRFPFAFMATYLANVRERGNSTHRPLKHALQEYAKKQEKMLDLLSTIKRASQTSNLIKDLIESGDIFEPLKWTPKDAQQFLEEVPLYNEAGVLCRIPNWWRSISQGAKLNFTVGNKKSSLLGTGPLVDFDINLSMGGKTLSEKEARALLDESKGLVLLKGQWVNVDSDNLSLVLDKWKEAKKIMRMQKISFSDAMKILSGRGNPVLGINFSEFEVTQGKWLQSLTEKLQSPKIIKDTVPSGKFKGVLRPYQQQGLNWLNTLHSLHLGGCLADDMGLGKTIQILAFLQKIIDKEKGLHLLIIPTSLLSNWTNEIFKFTPKLKFLMAHPSDQEFSKRTHITLKDLTANHNLVITTYGLIRRTEIFKKIQWDYIILDEAQAIKNSATSQTKAVKSLSSKNRLALTGTPIENHIGDLWSLFDFINPGVLGSKLEFQNMVKKLQKENKGMGTIKNVISPYILRRLKTDKKIISDLPSKIELKSYCYLSKKQAVQYKKLVHHVQSSLQEVGGIKRKGLILSSLMKFKQICNHSDQYMGMGPFRMTGSGKFERLKEICETIFDKREKVLIFTQFREIIPPLENFLFNICGEKGPTLHGGTSVKKRKKAVEMFQSNDYVPYFILSLKAGGTGLNLTAANHVIHFDRWWNPAVENQATDRAFRIGQKKKVVVHKFITKGTLEEKIDQMIEQKSKLFTEIIGRKSSEVKFTEMDDDQIINLIKMETGY